MQEEEYLSDLKKMYRHERYLLESDRKHHVWNYSDENDLYRHFPQAQCSMPFGNGTEDLQLTALRLALDELSSKNPTGYAIIVEYYLGEKITKTELARRFHISRQVATRKLMRYTIQLRYMAMKYLNFLTA